MRAQLDREKASWLEGLSSVTRSLGEVMEAQRLLVSAQARRLGMGVTDMRALRLLDIYGPMGHTELARRLDIRPASVTTLVDRLSAQGVLERVRSEDDRRRVGVQARPQALAASLAVWEPSIRATDQLSQELSEHDRAVVTEYLQSLTAIMLAQADEVQEC